MGNGGYAFCSEPEKRPAASFTDAQSDGDKFNYAFTTINDFDAGPFCTALGGTWNGFNGNPQCAVSLPAGYNSTNDAATEGLATSGSDAFIAQKFTNPSCPATLQSDTGWGQFNGLWGATGPVSINGNVVWDQRSRNYGYCNGGIYTVGLLRTRQLVCPQINSTRTLPNGYLQCFIPACCTKAGNPVSLVSGGKSAVETDYRGPGDLKLVHYYSSQSRFALPGSGAFVSAGNSYWQFSYQRHVISVIGNATLSAVLVREDGMLEAFNGSGVEILNQDGAADRLVNNGSAGWTLTLADGSVEKYGLLGNLTSITTLSGLVTTISYGSNSKISQVTDTFGHKLVYAYNALGQLSAVTLPDGTSTISYGYTGVGALQSVTYPDLSSRLYEYEDPHNSWLLTGITDENGQRFASYVYDQYGLVLHEEHAGGVEAYDFSVGGLNFHQEVVAGVTDPLGQYHQYVLDNQTGVYKLRYQTPYCPTCPNVQNDSFDANGNILLHTDLASHRTDYVFDQARNLETSRTEGTANGTATAATRTITTQWHPTLRLPAQIAVYPGTSSVGTPLRTTAMSYDSYGNILIKTITDGASGATRTWTRAYYNSGLYGQVHTTSGPRTDINDTSTYTYYSCSNGGSCGQVATITNAVGHVTTYSTYNADGQPLTITDANGVVTTLIYDLRQRLTSRQVGTETTTFDYYPTGLLKKATLPDGSYIQYTYDAAHRLTKLNDGPGNSVQYTLDAMGNRTAESASDPSSVLSRTRSRVYNALSELYQEIGAAGTIAVTTTLGYDAAGNQATIQAPLSRNTSNAYDELNRLNQITDPATGNTYFGYDANDNLVSVQDPKGLTTSYAYNGFGDLTRLTSPATAVTSNGYDSAGNIFTSLNARGKTATYSYDALNRVSQVAYGDQTIVYAYDAGTNGKGRLTGASDSSHAMTWQYDSLGRVSQKTQTTAGVAKSVNYVYANGVMTTLTTPSGQTIGYTYVNHQVDSIKVNGATLLSGVKYEPFGPSRGWTWGNGALETRLHDTDGNPSQITGPESTSYSLDSAFRITGITNSSNALLSWNYGYDSLDRLTSANTSGTAPSWTYDADGNRLSQAGAPGPAYVAANIGLTYNNRGRLSSVSTGSNTLNSVYNALGQRIWKSSSLGGTVLYVYDEAGHLVGEYGASGALVEETIWLVDTPVATLRPHSGGGIDIYYVHTDHLNTPRTVTRSTDNAIVWRWDADPFGVAAANANPSGFGTFLYNLRLPGQYFDGETGMNYNYFRDYDPQVGRYVESDPIGLEGGSLSTYTYVNAAPVRASDPSGLIKWKGEMYSALGSWPVGIGAFHFDLKSECINGKYAYVYISAKAFIAGLGANITGGAGPIEFDDGNLDIEPQGLQGTFRVFSAGLGAGLTYGWAYVQLGDAFSIPGAMPAPSIGFDASAVGGIGRSMLTHVEIKTCCALR